jgi:hypothetical protein
LNLSAIAILERSSTRGGLFESQTLENFLERNDAYLANLFVVARELIKPLKENFALEVCYLFDCIIVAAP